MKTIPLCGKAGTGLFAIVDDEDYELVAPFKWYLTLGYVIRNGPDGKANRKGSVTRMHRLICGLDVGDSRECDHRNLDKLDNRRGNLRVCTRGQNQQNLSGRGGMSCYRGVTFDKRWGRWRATATVDGRTHSGGYFDDELDAARAAQALRVQLMPFTVEEAIA